MFRSSTHQMYISIFNLPNDSRHQMYISIFNLLNDSTHQMYISIVNLLNDSRHQMYISIFNLFSGSNTGNCRRMCWKLTNFAKNTKFNLYCKEHERPCCRICMLENHKDCKVVTVLENIIKNIKTSNMLNEIERLIDELIETISTIRLNRETNASVVKEQKY